MCSVASLTYQCRYLNLLTNEPHHQGIQHSTVKDDNSMRIRLNVHLEYLYVFVWAAESMACQVLNISESLLHHDKNAENLQIVHYTEGQEYTPHHDFGDSGVSPHSRFLTLFIYIQPAEKGGGMHFALFPSDLADSIRSEETRRQ